MGAPSTDPAGEDLSPATETPEAIPEVDPSPAAPAEPQAGGLEITPAISGTNAVLKTAKQHAAARSDDATATVLLPAKRSLRKESSPKPPSLLEGKSPEATLPISAGSLSLVLGAPAKPASEAADSSSILEQSSQNSA